jgi:hypothetical protein
MDEASTGIVSRTPGTATLYEGARDVRARASVATNDDTPALRRAIDHLDKILATGRAPKTEVPRGFYLNIKV